jgi:hypothetical protein
MQLDMALAKTYKPVLVCIGKVSILTSFTYVSGSLIFPTERYGLLGASVYLDRWCDSEYVIDTNGCAVMVLISLLVHELRDAGVQERVHLPFAHNLVLTALIASNIIIITFGENWCTPPTALGPDGGSKRSRPCYQGHTPGPPASKIGSFICLVSTLGLLFVLSTCAMPVSSHDIVLNNLRIWSFTFLSLAWFYTINYRELGYNHVAPFTPCILRFSSVLFLPSLMLSLVGITLLTVSLTFTYMRLVQSQSVPPTPTPLTETLKTSVLREALSGSVVSYRAQSALCEKKQSERKPSEKKHSVETSGAGAVLTGASLLPYHTGGVEVEGNLTGIDFNSLFEQASLDHLA